MSELITPDGFACDLCATSTLKVLNEFQYECVGCGAIYAAVHKHHFDEVVEAAEQIIDDA